MVFATENITISITKNQNQSILIKILNSTGII